MKKRRVLRFCLQLCIFGTLCLAGVSGQIIGDVNSDGSVTIVDALMIAQYSVGNVPPDFDPVAGDVNNSLTIDILDALIVAQYYVCQIDCTVPLGQLPRVNNPFQGSTWYVNPLWSEQARNNGGEAIADYNTAIWLDSINSLTAGMGVRGHLDEALNQGANLIMFVLYDIPNRDCASGISEPIIYPPPDPSPMTIYKTEFIDPLAAIFANPAYRGIRIVCIIEPDTLPNLVTNLDIPNCQEAAGPDGYREGIQYVLNTFSKLKNVYSYLDIAHSGWLGWDSNHVPYVDLLFQVVQGTNAGFDSVSGFYSNAALYTPLEEPFLPDPNLQINGQPLKSSDFYEWNPYFDEKDYMLEMYNQLVARGFTDIGIIHDTSRNGWGGSSYGRTRPTKVSDSGELNDYVNESRIDRRYHRGNWCNQAGGIGFRPQAAPFPHCDAYVWIKPPGESDGISYAGPQDPDDPEKKFDIMCDPDGFSTYNRAFSTGAMDAPHRGRWNQALFEILLKNAYPPL